MNKIPDISAFQYDRMENGHMESSVNLYRGAVCFHYNLIELPKHENVGISINAAYNSDIDKNLTKSNLISPTGIMGLGWRLTYEKIECDKEDIGKNPVCRNYRLTTGDNPGGGTPLHFIEEKNGRLYFENEIYDYSRITYDCEKEIWEITEPSGVMHRYGSGKSRQYAVLSGGRYTEAACTNDAGQSRGIKAWNLSEIISPSGFTVKYGYAFTEQSVTGSALTYTKAAYIKTISDSYGNMALFQYADKEWSLDVRKPREYVDPHKKIPSDDFDFYQSEYETKYLTQIFVSNQYETLYSIRFAYELKNYAASIPILGDTVKRMLKEIQMVTKQGEMPAMQFTYNTQREKNAGALKRIYYPEGGSAEYSYGQNQKLCMSERTQIISNSGFSQPTKTFFGRDYVVVLQRNVSKVVISIYEWIGRWQKYTPDFSLDGYDPEKIQIRTMENYCIITGTTASDTGAGYWVLSRLRKVKGGWKLSAKENFRSADMELITGDNWFLVYQADSDTVSCYDYDERREIWEKGLILEDMVKTEAGYTRMFSAYRDRLFCFAYDELGGGRKNKAILYERSPLGDWRKLAEAPNSSIMLQGGSDGEFSLAFDGFAAAGAFVCEKSSYGQHYTLGIWRYDGEDVLKEDIMTNVSIPTQEASYIAPRIYGNTVICAGYLYRFCGDVWKECRDLAIMHPGNYQFALSEDIALASYVTDNGRQIKGAVFDKKKNSWKTQTLLQLQGEVSKIPSCGVSISGNIAVCADKVYDISMLTFDKVIEELDNSYGSAFLFHNTVCIAGSIYKEEEKEYKPCGAYIHTFENGKLIDRIEEARIFDENCGGYGNLFSLRSDADCKLFFAGGGCPDSLVTFYQATGVTLHDGIDSISRKYKYTPSLAACDESGQYARYAKVEVVSGQERGSAGSDNSASEKGIHRTVYCYRDSVSSVPQSKNATQSSVEDGTLLSIEAYCDNKLHNKFTVEYEFTNVVDGRTIYGDVLAGGVMTQMSEIDETGEGVIRTTEFRTDLLSGERRELVTYNYDVNGKKETHRRITQFAYEKYPALKEAHRLSEVCESILSVNDEIVSDTERIYDSVDGIFSEKRAVLINPQKSTGGGEDKILYDITGRGRFGVITARESMFYEYFTYDKTGCYQLAEFTNCRYGECFAYCFEAYEEPLFRPAAGACITDLVCYAGSRCLEIKAGKSSGAVTHHFQPSGTAYGFSFYAKGRAGCSLRISANGKTITEVLEDDDFTYHLVDLRELVFAGSEKTQGETLQAGAAQITFEFVNASKDSLFIDVIAFFPLLNPPRINIYDNGGALLAAALSGYGDISEPVYDALGRAVYLVGNKRTIHAQIPSFMRETGEGVNAELDIKNAKEGQFIRRIAAGQAYKASFVLAESFFALFFCSGSLEMQMGGVLIKREKDESGMEDKWSIKDEENHFYQTAFCTGNLIALIISEVVVFTVNGKVLFSYKASCRASCERNDKEGLSFTITAEEEVQDLAIGNKPVSSIRFYDGAGKIRQEQYCTDGKVCVTAKSYDSTGREWADTVPTYMEEDYFRYIPDYITEINSDTGVMKGKAAEKNPECEGYPYYSKIYEACSGGRVREKGSPCHAYAVDKTISVDKRHTVRMSYEKGASFLPALKGLASCYTLMTVCDPDNNKIRTVYDLQRKEIAHATEVNGTQLITTYTDEYRDGIRTVSVKMPNGNLKKNCYDFTGNLIAVSDVNAGDKKFFYDGFGHLRFSRDAVLDKMGLCKYRLYDDLYRLTEEGLCPLLSDEELSRRALEASYPESGKIISRHYHYDGDYSINQIGRLTQIALYDESEKNEVLSSISITADKLRHTISKTTAIGTKHYTTTSCYDNLGNMIRETGTDGSMVEYFYDEASRMKIVSRNGSVLSETRYRADGLPKQVISCGNTISYEYDARGKVTGIDSPFYREKVVYLEDDKTGYYNGKIKSVETEIKGAADTDTPVRVKYDLSYDENGRLLSALCKEHPELSLTEITYDGNGNILSCKSGKDERKFTLYKGSDKLAFAGSAEYKYDENGAVTDILRAEDGGVHIEYYKHSGLPKRFVTEVSETEVLYDENNRRLKKTVSKEGRQESSNLYFYDGVRLSEQIRNGESVKYIHGANGLHAVSCGGSDYSVVTDRLGYTRVVAECQKIIQAYHYKPFGEAVEVIKESELVRILFGNYELDKETGLYYAKSRMYDPYAYRFLSPDIEGEFPSPYLFCGNDPFAVIDENGERSWYAALIGAVIGIVLTIGLSVLTLGAAAPVATAIFGTGGAAITATTSAAQTAAIVAYNTMMTFAVTAISGFASEGTKSLIDGEPYTAACVYDTLLGASAAGLVFGGAATLIGSVGKFVVADSDAGLAAAAKYMKQGMVLSLVNSGVSAAVSPVGDVINGEPANGIHALESAGFGALSGAVTTFAAACAESKVLDLKNDIVKETVNDIIGSCADPAVYYETSVEALDAADSANTAAVYDTYTVGTKIYAQRSGAGEAVSVKQEQKVYEYACFGSSGAGGKPSSFGKDDCLYQNMLSPRYLVTRGLF